jgi:AraC-like DNA-binding protein
MSLSLLNVISIVTGLVGLLYAFQVGTLKKSSKGEHLFFSIFFICLSALVFLFLLIDLEIKGLSKYLIPSVVILALLLGPLLGLYINCLLQNRKKKSGFKNLLIPLLIGVAIILSEYFTLSAGSKESKQMWAEILTLLTLGSISFVFITQNCFYLYKSFKLFKAYQSEIANIYSFQEGVSLSWLRVLLFGYIGLILGFIGIHFIPGDVSNFIFNLLILVYFIYTGHNAMKQVIPENLSSEETIKTIDEINNVEKRPEQVQLFEEIKSNLLHCMLESKPYLNSDLTINQLAKTLHTNSKYLSTVINQEFGKSFVHFINEYRIQEAKLVLLENSNLTIEAQSEMVGFKSKSSFNVAFKKNTGMTPSTYIQEHHTRLSNNK